MQYERKPDSRPRELAEEEINKMAKKLEEMILAASQEYRLTAKMLKTVIACTQRQSGFSKPSIAETCISALIARSLILMGGHAARKAHGRLTEDSRKTHERLTKDTRKTL